MEFLFNFLGAILGCGVGGTIIYLAGQKFIENITETRFEEIEDRLTKVERTKVSSFVCEKFQKLENKKFEKIEDNYVSLKVFEVSQKYLNESLKEIKGMIMYLTEKFDEVGKNV